MKKSSQTERKKHGKNQMKRKKTNEERNTQRKKYIKNAKKKYSKQTTKIQINNYESKICSKKKETRKETGQNND